MWVKKEGIVFLIKIFIVLMVYAQKKRKLVVKVIIKNVNTGEGNPSRVNNQPNRR